MGVRIIMKGEGAEAAMLRIFGPITFVEWQVKNAVRYCNRKYEGESNENLKSAIKIRNTARLSCKLTIVILMV